MCAAHRSGIVEDGGSSNADPVRPILLEKKRCVCPSAGNIIYIYVYIEIHIDMHIHTCIYMQYAYIYIYMCIGI